jgi:predicted RNA polymerase sigma factor
LMRAHGHRRPGRFQYEAAIQSVHSSRQASGPLDDDRLRTLRTLHRALMRVAPSLGAAVALAALDGELEGPDAGLRALDGLGGAIDQFQPAVAVRAHLFAVAGREDAAADCYRQAIALTSAPAVAKFLEGRLRACSR